MQTKEDFIKKMGNLWERLQTIEEESIDLYEFEEKFEKAMNNISHQFQQDLIGSNNLDRRVKKNSKHDME
jgi:hypothetical protein